MTGQYLYDRQGSRRPQQWPSRFFEAKNSNGIIDVGYNKSTSELDIRFRGLEVRRYVDVPETVFLELRKAWSTARYFHDNIRLKYTSNKINFSF